MRPEMPILISSGFDESEAVQQFGDVASIEFLKKPYTAATLIRKVQGMLAKSKSE